MIGAPPLRKNLSPRRPAAYAEKAKGAAYRMKASPELRPLRERRIVGGAAIPVSATARTVRFTFEKLGDAGYLSHRNTMDVLERAFRAGGIPVRYTEGFNPHMRMSMGPALPLGQESRHELFDVDLADAMTPDFLDVVNSRLPAGVRVTGFEDLPKGSRSLGQSATEAVYRFVLPNGEERRERLRLAGEGAMTPKRFLESEYGLAPEDQHGIRVIREDGRARVSFTVRVSAEFEAAHHLRDYVGGPEPAHGHSWKIEVALTPSALGPYDLSVDFVPTEPLVRAGRPPPRSGPQRSPAFRPAERDRRERRALGGGRDRDGRAPEGRHTARGRHDLGRHHGTA